MNNYILVVKRPGKDFIIDSSSDDLRLLSERWEDLKDKSEFSDLITLNELNKLYFNDEVSKITKSMKLYQFYPVFRIRLGFKDNSKISSITHCIVDGLTSNPRKYEEDIKKSFIDVLNSTKAHNVLNSKKYDINDVIMSKCVFIGMETWIPDSMGNYHSRCGKMSDEYVFKSFLDYIKRHSNSPKPVDEDDCQDLEMSYNKYDRLRCNDFPVPNKLRGIHDLSQVKLYRSGNLVAIRLK